MPHFIIDCSANILAKVPEEKMLATVFDATRLSGLFEVGDIKVRVNPYVRYEVGGRPTDFVHVFIYILQGRTDKEKANLSRLVVRAVVDLLPEVEFVASSIDEFSIAGYCNKQLLTN